MFDCPAIIYNGDMNSKLKTLFINLLLLVLGVGVALLLLEGILRWYQQSPFVETAVELSWMRDNPGYNIFTVDPEFGFRPILGNGLYNQYGTKENNYPFQKRPDVTRLLFIGDSVTHRAKIINAIKDIYGQEKYEYWNAGVESYNTVQEVSYYKRYNAALKPDHVILTFHINDFETTPIAFNHPGDGLIVYAPNKAMSNLNPWLFKHSYLYRFVTNLSDNAIENREAIVQEAATSLHDLQQILAADDIDFTVLVLPVFIPYEGWQPHEKEARAKILNILAETNIHYYDLFNISEQAIAAGIEVQEVGGHWHPNEAVSALFAQYLFEHNLLLVD